MFLKMLTETRRVRMTIQFDSRSKGRNSKVDLDDFFHDRLTRDFGDRAEVLAEQDLYRFRSGPDVNALVYDSLRTSGSLWSELANYAGPSREVRWIWGHGNGATVFRREAGDNVADQREIGTNPTKSQSSAGEEAFDGYMGETRVVSIGKMHAMFWFALVIGGISWGVVAGASLFAGVGLSPTVAVFGVLGTVALSATVFALSLQNVARRHEW